MNDKIKKLDRLVEADRADPEKPVLPTMGWDEIMARVGEGLILELGVFAGESFDAICQAIYPRVVYGFDWFYGLVEDWGAPDTKGSVSRNGKPPPCPPNGEFIIGRVEATLPRFIATKNESVAFCHFDMDTYTPTRIALDHLDPALRSGSILVFDEIDNDFRNESHEGRALREWLVQTQFDFEIIGRRHWQAWVVRLI